MGFQLDFSTWAWVSTPLDSTRLISIFIFRTSQNDIAFFSLIRRSLMNKVTSKTKITRWIILVAFRMLTSYSANIIKTLLYKYLCTHVFCFCFLFFLVVADDKTCNYTIHCIIGNSFLEQAIQVTHIRLQRPLTILAQDFSNLTVTFPILNL